MSYPVQDQPVFLEVDTVTEYQVPQLWFRDRGEDRSSLLGKMEKSVVSERERERERSFGEISFEREREEAAEEKEKGEPPPFVYRPSAAVVVVCASVLLRHFPFADRFSSRFCVPV